MKGVSVTVSSAHLALPASSFLAQVVAGVASLKGVRVEQPTPNMVTIHHRAATIVWFIARNDAVSVLATDDPSGCTVTISGRGPQKVADLLELLTSGEAERNFAAVAG